MSLPMWHYHGDEYYVEAENDMKSLDKITIEDLMSENHRVIMRKSIRGFSLEIDNDSGETILSEKEVHPFAIESFALFCKDFLYFYNKENIEI